MNRAGHLRGEQTELMPSGAAVAALWCPDSTEAWQASSRPAASRRKRRSPRGQSCEDRGHAQFKQQLFKFGMDPLPPQTPEQFAATIKAEQAALVKAIKDSGQRWIDATRLERYQA